MEYQYLKARGALNEAAAQPAAQLPRGRVLDPAAVEQMLRGSIPESVVELIPESVARENKVMPLAFDGETVARCPLGRVTLHNLKQVVRDCQFAQRRYLNV